jgi:phosphotransferase system HPr-like phosphotransfer protein
MLAASKGTELLFTVIGDDGVANEALDAITALINERFGEDR